MKNIELSEKLLSVATFLLSIPVETNMSVCDIYIKWRKEKGIAATNEDEAKTILLYISVAKDYDRTVLKRLIDFDLRERGFLK